MPGAFTYKMDVAEAAEIKVIGNRVHRVVLDFEFKKTIQRLCYAHTEAGFLPLVAPHGGDFVRRQFDAWIGLERGKRSEDFLTDLLDRGHGRSHVFAHNRQVCHLRFRPLYRAVGDEDSRNRREHQPQSVKARLRALDYVLAHSETATFATECEKVTHVYDERGIGHEALPAKVFRGHGDSSTRRCFLDRFPLFSRPGAGELVFCYVDSGFETSGLFATHLRRYLPLFGELPSFELGYVATAWTQLGQAHTVFERLLSRGRKGLPKVADPDRLLAHFRDRKLLRNVKPATSIGSGSIGCATTWTRFLVLILPRFSRVGRPPATSRFGRNLPLRRCPTDAFPPAFCLTITTSSGALRRPLEPPQEPAFGERSKKGPFTSVSMEAFTKDTLRSPSTGAIRSRPWRIDPIFGVRGGAGATPVSVGCAATNPFRPRSAPAWVTPAPLLPRANAFRHANRIAG